MQSDTGGAAYNCPIARHANMAGIVYASYMSPGGVHDEVIRSVGQTV